MASSSPTLAVPKAEIEQRILEFASEYPGGITHEMIENELPALSKDEIVKILNNLLQKAKVQLMKKPNGKVFIKLQDPGSVVKVKGGDVEEQVVYKIIQESQERGIWAREIRAKSNLHLNTVEKVLRKLESKKLIKSFNSVAAPKKKLYLLFNLEPDRSLTGGPWYSDQRFDSQFVEVLNQRCYIFLEKAAKNAKEVSDGLIAERNTSFVSSQEVLDHIMKSGITKINLTQSDIETILNTLVYDGKIEQSITGEDNKKIYRAVNSFNSLSPLLTIPCGVCPLIEKCADVGDVTPKTCQYMQDWMDKF